MEKLTGKLYKSTSFEMAPNNRVECVKVDGGT